MKQGRGRLDWNYFVQSMVKNDHKQIEPPLAEDIPLVKSPPCPARDPLGKKVGTF